MVAFSSRGGELVFRTGNEKPSKMVSATFLVATKSGFPRSARVLF
jgi:hypothetical protein